MSPEHRAAIVRAFVAIVIADLRRSGVLPMPAGEDLKEEGASIGDHARRPHGSQDASART